MTAIPDLASWSAVELAARIRSRELSPVEVTEACIRRVEAANPALNAVVATRYGEARAEARRAEARAREPDPPPLLGVPCTVKELLAVRGMPHTAGIVARRHVVADRDATVVRRLKDAGAIVLGVTHGPEGGGEAALIAAGGVPFGVGSDTGGSIRIPAGLCGIAGHKPTGGLVPATGHFPPAPGGADVPMAVGPLARTVDDLALVLGVISGPDGIDPHCGQTLPPEEEVDWTRVTLHPMASSATPAIAAAVHKVAFALAERGATIGAWTGPDLSGAFEAWAALLDEELASNGALDRPRALRELVRWPFGRARGREARAEAARELREAFDRAIGPLGIVIHPILPRPRRRALALRDPRDCAALFNVTESPVTAVHVDTDPQGMPIGVQLAGARGRDRLTLAAGRALEAVFGSQLPRPVPGAASRR